MKDVPMNLPDGFELAAICTREDPRDAFVSNRYAALADCRRRRGGHLQPAPGKPAARALPAPDHPPLRGSVQTRLRKLDDGEFDAIILAAAGLKRLGLSEADPHRAGPQKSLPAVGQGALGIEILEGRAELAALLLAPLNDAVTAACVRAERAMSRAEWLLPGAAGRLRRAARRHAHPERLCRQRGRPDLPHRPRDAPARYADALGRAVAKQLLDKGADDIIAALDL